MGTFKSYLSGFVLSAFLTLLAFTVVIEHLVTGWNLIWVVVGLALIQLYVQLIFFLHLDHEFGPRWNLAVFLGTVGLIFILVGGSLWIMNNLNYNHNHMSPQDTEDYLFEQEAIPK